MLSFERVQKAKRKVRPGSGSPEEEKGEIKTVIAVKTALVEFLL
jgi:hypothetical protein